MKCFR